MQVHGAADALSLLEAVKQRQKDCPPLAEAAPADPTALETEGGSASSALLGKPETEETQTSKQQKDTNDHGQKKKDPRKESVKAVPTQSANLLAEEDEDPDADL
eukprot:SAG22_NODE_113_length_19407_cov_214.925161_11_plen_104_part_00